MVTIRRPRAVTALVLLLATVPAAAADREWEERAVRRGPIADDLYVAGREVDVDAEVRGDVIAAGGRVTVGRAVRGDVNAAGGTVRLVGRVADDARVAGGEVTIEAQVADDLVAAGGRVRLAPGASVGGRVRVAGGEVDLAGRAGRDVLAAAGTLRIGGQVAGDVQAAAGDIVVLPGARIAGRFDYWSARPARIDPSARIDGPITQHQPEVGERAARAARQAGTAARIVAFLGLLVAGVVLYLLLPRFTVAAAATIGSDPWKSLGLGFALLVATPVAVVLLLVTVIGIPLGLALLALYFVLLLVGFLMAAFFLSDLGLRAVHWRTPPSGGMRLLFFLAALVVLWLVRLVPFLGGWVLFVALLLGVGAWTVRTYRAWAGPREAPRHA
jgi:hypothetical protein